MKNFKEWLSDNLRYILLFLAGVLFAGIIWIGIRVYQQYDSPTAGQNIEILPEQETEKITEKVTEKDTEKDTEKKEESESEDKEDKAQKESEQKPDDASDDETKRTEQSGDTEADADAFGGQASNTENSSGSNADTNTNAAALAGLGANGADAPQTPDTKEPQQSEQIVDVEPETQAQTQPPTEAEPVYMTLNQACNFRSGPGYEYEVVAEYWAGTVVEYLGMVEGWAEVRIDGTVGYMGRQFLS